MFPDKAFSFDIKTVRDADQWQKILEAINAEEMPPEEEPPPLKNDKLEFLEMLSLKLVEARKALSDSGGVGTAGRSMGPKNFLPPMMDVVFEPRSDSSAQPVQRTFPLIFPKTSLPPRVMSWASKPGKPLVLAG